MTNSSIIRCILLWQKEIEDVGDKGVNNRALDGGGSTTYWRKIELVSFTMVLYYRSHSRGLSLEFNK